ncbi:phage tail protein [Salmonella enterica]|uniref:tail spike protein n=1 Tax=Citrobacter freundii complex TaxID=1344959 RepID=UPI0017484926|nr:MULTISPECIES: tail spike protein [Citrobacter freundii complex]EFP6375638.1 phage tail protein [Salmonella enterica]EFS0697605.1 phage tail protein [Salmonella enterica]EFT4988657.1 phage tail protein [Salmonella enterica]EGB4921664.1 phage tail protein [Salmonella enterica]EGF6120227.1 phage tail protein [Salmonella enterica]
MTTYNTGNPLGSAAAKDLYDNAENFDHLSNDQSNEKWPDRFGRERLTWHGIEKMSQEAISSFGYITLKSFQLGAPLPNNELTLPNQALQDETDGEYYRWDGVFPKAVPAGSTPESTGGIGVGKWLSVGDAAFREEANKKYKYSVKLSDYLTLQESASAAVDGLLIDEDYHFTDGESVDFSGKVLTIDCKAKFIGDGVLNWNNLGSGSKVISPHMHTYTTPYTVYRFDDNGNWVTNPTTVLASVAQRLDKGYKPNVNDLDIWASLPDYVKNQVAGATLRVNSANNINVVHPEATMGGYLFTLCNHILVESPRNFIAWESGITFENHHTTTWGTGNKVVGGEIKYGSGSAVLFIRNDGGDDHDGGVQDLISYRVGESGVKTYQNEIGGRSARNYRLVFDNITTIQCYYDGIDVNADTGSPTERADDYTLAEYPWFQLPTQHIIRNIITRDCMGIGAWWDGQLNIIDNVVTYEAHKEGVFDRGTNNDITNVTVVGANKDLTNLNQIVCEGGSRLRGIMVHAYTTQGYAVYAPSSEISNVSCAGSGTKKILCTYIAEIQGGNINVQHGDNIMTLGMRPAMGGTTNPSLLMTADCQVATPGGEASIVKLSAIQDGVRAGELQLNRLGFKHMSIPVAPSQLPESALELNSSVGFFFGTDGALRLLAKKPDGTFTTYSM